MGPLRGDGNTFPINNLNSATFMVEKMGPLRGDGNYLFILPFRNFFIVEKMGPLRGDGNPARTHL